LFPQDARPNAMVIVNAAITRVVLMGRDGFVTRGFSEKLKMRIMRS